MAAWRRIVWIAVAFSLGVPPVASVASVCGDGLVEPGEECDDGPGNGVDSCCSTSCIFVDTDLDSVCDALDPCPSPATVVLRDVELKIGGLGEPSRLQTLRLRATVPLPAGEPRNPGTSGVRFVVSRIYYLGISLDVAVPGGSGWTSNGAGSAWRYRDPSAQFAGITDVRVTRPDPEGPVGVSIRGRGGYTLAPDVFPAKVSVAFAPGMPASNECGEAWIGRGLCALSASGRTLSCEPPPRLRVCRGDPDTLVRCDLRNVASAQEAQFMSRDEYVVGVCTDVPGFIASPFVTCTTAPDGLGFTASTAHAQARQACDWRSVPPPGTDPMTCGPLSP